MLPERFAWWLVISILFSCVALPALETIEQEWLWEPIPEIPILMYHVIGDDNSRWQELFVKPEEFHKQITYLYEEGFHTITLQQLYAHWEQGIPLPPKPIILSFDDGYRSVYHEAYLKMKPYNYHGVIFTYVNKFEYPNSMSEAEIRSLINEGWELGCHTYSHKDLTTLDAAQLDKELCQAKAQLSEMFDVSILSLCYPSGQYNAAVIAKAEQAGFLIGVTTQYGMAQKEQGLLTLRRIRINRSDSLAGFIKKLNH